MSLKFSVGDFTVHRIIEQETTFLQANDALPTLTPEILAENREWLQNAAAQCSRTHATNCNPVRATAAGWGQRRHGSIRAQFPSVGFRANP